MAAGLFRPLLSRVQWVVDRRFNREKFDGQREIEKFGAVLTDEVQTDRALAELLAVTRRTLAPTTVSLWVVDRTLDAAANPPNTP